MTELVKLFEPGYIGEMRVKNRIMMPAMQTRGADPEGFVTDALIGYYEERAKGGLGLSLYSSHLPGLKPSSTRGIALYDDKYIPRLGEMARAVQRYGAK